MSASSVTVTAELRVWFTGRLVPDGECRLHPGRAATGSLGYAQVRLPKEYGRRNVMAHRLAFYLAHGRWPALVRHTCDRPRCANAAHLLEGTQRDNIHDCIDRGRARNGNLKLTPTAWAEIRESSAPSSELAWHYGVSAAHVRRIRRTQREMVYRP